MEWVTPFYGIQCAALKYANAHTHIHATKEKCVILYTKMTLKWAQFDDDNDNIYNGNDELFISG